MLHQSFKQLGNYLEINQLPKIPTTCATIFHATDRPQCWISLYAWVTLQTSFLSLINTTPPLSEMVITSQFKAQSLTKFYEVLSDDQPRLNR